MSIYSDFASAAVEMLTEFGTTYEFAHTEEGVYNPGSGGSITTVSVYRALGLKDMYSNEELGNSSIETGDVRMYCEEANFTVGDTCTFDNNTWRVVSSTPIKPATEAVLYILQLRS